MKTFFEAIEKFFSIEIANNFKLYNLLAIIFKYIFAFIIFYFIFNIIKMIYLDINTVESSNMDRPSGAVSTLSSCSTRSRRRTRTCSTSCSRSWTTGASRTVTDGWWTSRTPSRYRLPLGATIN